MEGETYQRSLRNVVSKLDPYSKVDPSETEHVLLKYAFKHRSILGFLTAVKQQPEVTFSSHPLSAGAFGHHMLLAYLQVSSPCCSARSTWALLAMVTFSSRQAALAALKSKVYFPPSVSRKTPAVLGLCGGAADI